MRQHKYHENCVSKCFAKIAEAPNVHAAVKPELLRWKAFRGWLRFAEGALPLQDSRNRQADLADEAPVAWPLTPRLAAVSRPP